MFEIAIAKENIYLYRQTQSDRFRFSFHFQEILGLCFYQTRHSVVLIRVKHVKLESVQLAIFTLTQFGWFGGQRNK